MTVIRFLFRNWPLKVGAIVLATILYGGMVVLSSAGTWPNKVPIDFVNIPTNAVLLDDGSLPTVSQVRYLAPADVPVDRTTFKATVDLSHATPSETSPVLAKVDLAATDPRIQILDFSPPQVSVRLDPIVQRTVPVHVKHNDPPAGLELGDVNASEQQVSVFGAASYVRRVAAAQATVAIEPSGLDVDQNVDLVAVDATGAPIDRVELNPPTVHVRIQVGSQLRTTTLPIAPIVSDSPAAGYAVSGIDVKPAIGEFRGEADALALIRSISTQPISIAGATSDVTATVPLALPQGIDSPSLTTVKVTVHLQAMSGTRTISVGIVPDGARNDRIYELSTTSVSVTLGGPLAALNALDTTSLVASVSVGNLDAGSHTVNVSVLVPAGITSKVTPARIVVTVTVPPPPTPTPAPLPSPSPTAS